MNRRIRVVLLPCLIIASLGSCESRTKVQRELETNRVELDKQRELLHRLETESTALEQEIHDATAKALPDSQREKIEEKIKDLEQEVEIAQVESVAAEEAAKAATSKLASFKTRFLPP